MPRLFTGLEIPAKEARGLTLLQNGLQGARWVDHGNFHITLRFIGDVETGLAREIFSSLAEIQSVLFCVKLDGLDSFGGRKPRSLYARVAHCEELINLQRKQERMMQRLGLEPEQRRFTPHVTLARIGGIPAQMIADYLAIHGGYSGPEFEVSRFVLYSARGSVGGGPYIAEKCYDLKAPVKTEIPDA